MDRCSIGWIKCCVKFQFLISPLQRNKQHVLRGNKEKINKMPISCELNKFSKYIK